MTPTWRWMRLAMQMNISLTPAAPACASDALDIEHHDRQHGAIAARVAAPSLRPDQLVHQAGPAVELGHRIELQGRVVSAPGAPLVAVASPQHEAGEAVAQGRAQGHGAVQRQAQAREFHGDGVQAGDRGQRQQAARPP